MATPTATSYTKGSGLSINGGRPAVVTLLETAVAAMAPNTMQLYLGTNINEMIVNPYDGLTYGVFEGGEANKTLAPWSNKGNFNKAVGVLSFVGTAEGNASYVPAGGRSLLIAFDMASNQFTKILNPFGRNEGHCYDATTSVPLDGFLYRRGYNTAIISKAHTVTLERTPTAYTTTSPLSGLQVVSLEAHPQMGVEGAVCAFGEAGQVWTIDKATGVRTTRSAVTGTARYSVSCYVEASQRIVFGGGELGATSFWEMDASGTVSQIAQTLPPDVLICCSGAPGAAGGPLVAHPSEDAVLLFSHTTNEVWKMARATGVWTKLANFPAGFLDHADECIAVSLVGRGAVALLRGRGRASGVTQSEFWLFKV